MKDAEYSLFLKTRTDCEMKTKFILICIACLIIISGCIKKEPKITDHSYSQTLPPTESAPAPKPVPPNIKANCTYTIQVGDTLSQIAERFYGTTQKCDTVTPLQEYNDIRNTKELMPGKQIRLPIVTCKTGNTLEPNCENPFTIPKPKDHKKKYSVICKSVIQDHNILIYTFRKGDTIQKVAYRFYGKRSDCDTVVKLKDYNNITRPDKMMPGDQIKLPVIYCNKIDTHLAPKCLTPAPPPAPSPTPLVLPGEYQKAINLYASSHFEEAKKEFEALQTKEARIKLRQIALAYLTLIAVAYDNDQDRDHYLKEIIRSDPKRELEDLTPISPDLKYRLRKDIVTRYHELRTQLTP